MSDGAESFEIRHSAGLAELLERLKMSLLLTNYQAGGLVAFRAEQGRVVPRLRVFDKPMGMAVHGRFLALGTRQQIWTFVNVPELGCRVEPGSHYDACFVPRTSHVTGDIRVHEMAFAGDELWFINTRHCCLCTLHAGYSFVPRWRPPFVSDLVPEDRCHLNGLAMVDGQPRYVTALAETDEQDGWRSVKATAGVVIDVPSGEVVARGLSMPHSPRWHNGTLWVLESGRGRLVAIDRASGRWETVAELPGFTRGLSFHGPLAFIGLSKMRETAVFGGLPIEARRPELQCGVYVVDTRSGRSVAFLTFQERVEELFAVEVLPGVRAPELIGLQKDAVSHLFMVPAEEELGRFASRSPWRPRDRVSDILFRAADHSPVGGFP